MAKKPVPTLVVKSYLPVKYTWRKSKVETYIPGGMRLIIVEDNDKKPPFSKTDNTIQKALADKLAKGPRAEIVS